MNLFIGLVVCLLYTCRVHAKAAFAHFMVSNSYNYTLADWQDDIHLAQAAHIDAFALNTAYNQGDGPQYDLAFQAAAGTGFQLFFSFDYAGNGAWPKNDVIQMIQKYGSRAEHYKYQGKIFVSTFEGPASASDWVDIKGQTGCFFVPDWSSLGAKAAMSQANGVADGLFSWAAWPWGNTNMDTFVDASYRQYLNGKPYMMPVSPWFYTNLPGYNKNWMWRGDDLWFDRWQEILYIQPEWVEIISWNDYGESHYIGPIRSKALQALTTGRAPLDYVSNMPHDAWRDTLPFSIDMYERNTTTISNEKITFWYRPQPASACSSGGTSGNTATQLQYEFPPAQVAQDRIFYTAILASPADVSVSIGGSSQAGNWSDVPPNGVGLYHGSVAFNGLQGAVTITLSRSGNPIAVGGGIAISSSCTNGLENWNAWVGSASSGTSVSATPLSMNNRVCTNGISIGNFAGLCSFACNYGYCPIGACLCKATGSQQTLPPSQNVNGYPAAGLDANYAGLCSFDCNYGYCPPSACSNTSSPLTTPTVSPFLPPACTAGKGDGQWAGLCSYSCNYGFCPIKLCQCTGQGALNVPPPVVSGMSGSPPVGVDDAGLCQFACSRGSYCPGPCTSSNSTDTTGGTNSSGSGDSASSPPQSTSSGPPGQTDVSTGGGTKTTGSVPTTSGGGVASGSASGITKSTSLASSSQGAGGSSSAASRSTRILVSVSSGQNAGGAASGSAAGSTKTPAPLPSTTK